MRAKSIHTISVLASAIAMALPSTSTALGLGRLSVQSSLGQPLSAQIELTSASREELDSIAAKIADPALYRQNNLSYQGVLARARVTVERSANGQAFLKVSTLAPVNEPYLDLMVELNWAAGRVVREYTFLLDPPGVAAPTPAVEPVTPRTAGAAPRAAPAAAPPARAEARESSNPPRTSASNRSADSYNVRRGDSLARIANQLRPDGVTLEQMLVALFKANPDAFEGGNMNRLRSGAILTVPKSEEIAGTPDNEASRVVRMQASDWRSYRDRVAAGAPVSESAGGRESTGKITTAVQDRTPAAEPGKDQVRVSREAGTGKGGVGGPAVEDRVAQERALKEAQTRIADLEKTLKDLQRAMEMRNQTMAQIQNQADTGKSVPAKAGAPVAGVAPVPTPAAPAVEPPKASEPMKAAEPPRGDTQVPPKSAPVTPPSVTPTPAPAPAASTSASSSTPAAPVAKSEPPKPAPKPAAKAEPKSEASSSFIDDILAAPSWVLGAAVAALLAAIAGIFLVRRRKTASFEDSIISGTDIKSNTVFGSTGGGIVNTGENSLSSDFSREGLSTIDTDEVDPIAEAEVYLAYGRDAQAEEILKDALKKDPQRQEVYLKLLEIHAQHNKPSAFDAVAAELYSVSHGQGEIWHKAVALGRQLDPNNPMFAEGGAPQTAAAAGAVAAAAAPRGEAPMESPVRAVETPRSDVPPVPVGVADLDHSMDFQLDDDISVTPAQAASRKPHVEAPHTSDVGMHFDTSRTPQRAMSGEPRIDAAHAAEAGLRDLDFHLEDTDKPAPLRAVGEPNTPAPTLARPQAAIDLDKLDLSFDPERTTFEDPTPSVLDGQWHDAATKLDLAKAYQEMGDVEGAREILQEVLHEGDDQQKGEAGALLAKLA